LTLLHGLWSTLFSLRNIPAEKNSTPTCDSYNHPLSTILDTFHHAHIPRIARGPLRVLFTRHGELMSFSIGVNCLSCLE
jgi:hypothetical protein